MKESEESKEAIEELSKGLEELENVQIKASKDFSSIISDVIDSVVLIQAGKGAGASIGSGVFPENKIMAMTKINMPNAIPSSTKIFFLSNLFLVFSCFITMPFSRNSGSPNAGT